MELTQRLISTRRGSLYASLVAALLAGIVILAYVNHYRNNLQATATPVTVLVARHTITKGTAGSRHRDQGPVHRHHASARASCATVRSATRRA